VAILAGQPNDWDTVNKEAMVYLKEARERLGNPSDKQKRRGDFATIGSGVSYGGGQTKPMNFDNKGKRAEVVKNLNEQRCFRRIAGFQSCKHGGYRVILKSKTIFSCLCYMGTQAVRLLRGEAGEAV
jgi:hypothetical protein